MVTIIRGYGLRVVIFLNDHLPAHVHVIGKGEAKINLVGRLGRPELVWADRMSKSDVRLAMELVTDNRDRLMRKWELFHGRETGRG